MSVSSFFTTIETVENKVDILSGKKNQYRQQKELTKDGSPFSLNGHEDTESTSSVLKKT